MCGESEKTTESSKSSTYDPWVSKAGQDIYAAAKPEADKPWVPYTGATQAGFGAGTNAAENYGLSSLGQTNPNMDAAGSKLKDLLGTLDPNKSIASYMDPYYENALNPTIRKINESADATQSGIAGAASMSGAFGDSGYGVRSSLNDRDRATAIGDATAGATDKAWNSAVTQRQADLSTLLSGSSGLASIGQAENSQNNTLASLLAGIGQQKQTAGQTGINTDIALNTQNQTAPMQKMAALAAILGALPKNQQTTGTETTTQPDNSGFGLLGSLLSGPASSLGGSMLGSLGTAALSFI